MSCFAHLLLNILYKEDFHPQTAWFGRSWSSDFEKWSSYFIPMFRINTRRKNGNFIVRKPFFILPDG